MKILMLAPEFLPLKGGVGTYVVELIKNMPKDVEIHVLTPNNRKNDFGPKKNFNRTENEEILNRCVIHNIGKEYNDFFSNFNFQINCRKYVPSIVKKNNIDLVHSQSALPDIFLNAITKKAPIITTIHTTIRDEISSTISSGSDLFNLSSSEKTMIMLGPFLKLLEKSYYTDARKYITVSNWMKKKMICDFKLDPSIIEVIYNGVNSKVFNPSEKKNQEKYFPELTDINIPKVLFLSRWVERKGIRYYLEAIPKISEQCNVHFVFAGPTKKLKSNIPLKNCTHLGYIPQEKIPCLYASSDIFILPSLYENFPISLLEAMSSGQAVISTNVGGIQEMITHGENGLIIKPKCTNDIVESIVRLAENEDLQKKLGTNARHTVEKNYSWEKSALKTKEYYQRIVENENLTH